MHFLTSVGIYVNIVMLGSICLAMSLDFATLTLVKKVRNLQHENLPIQDINFPTKNSKSPDLGSRMYHMYEGWGQGPCCSHTPVYDYKYLDFMQQS